MGRKYQDRKNQRKLDRAKRRQELRAPKNDSKEVTGDEVAITETVGVGDRSSPVTTSSDKQVLVQKRYETLRGSPSLFTQLQSTMLSLGTKHRIRLHMNSLLLVVPFTNDENPFRFDEMIEKMANTIMEDDGAWYFDGTSVSTEDGGGDREYHFYRKERIREDAEDDIAIIDKGVMDEAHDDAEAKGEKDRKLVEGAEMMRRMKSELGRVAAIGSMLLDPGIRLAVHAQVDNLQTVADQLYCYFTAAEAGWSADDLADMAARDVVADQLAGK